MSKKRIDEESFLNNTKIYTRFSSPSLSLEKLLDRKCTLSPLTRIHSYLEQSEIEMQDNQKLLLYELQTLTNMYRAEVGSFVRLMINELKKHQPNNDCKRKIENFLDQICRFIMEFRTLHMLFLDPHISEIHKNALAWADESISIITDRNMNHLFSYCRNTDGAEKLLETIEHITKDETDYRRSMHYEYLYNEEDPHSGESLAYREGVLKKWSQSAMYMHSEDSSLPRRISHMLAGAAAGVAMIFAVLFTIYASKMFVPNSTPWIVLIVFSYIFKDRIKEILRDIFKHLLPRLTSEQMMILFDPASGAKVGVSKGSLNFIKVAKLPDIIRNMRYRQVKPFRTILPENDIIHYRRTIKLNTKKIKKNHVRLGAVTDIIRLNINDWLREMDDPKDVFYRLENGRKIKIKGKRVYIIHLIASLEERHGRDGGELYHYKIICNKTGILRIEKLKKEIF